MQTILFILFLACFTQAAERPLVSLDFETNLVNAGTLLDQARFHTYASGEDPCFAQGPRGYCLDLTAASRHGGTTPNDPPAGGAVRYHHPSLDTLDTFTIAFWARQNPYAVNSASARLLNKSGAWDLLPTASGLALMLGADTNKVPYTLANAKHFRLTAEWTFYALVVSPKTITAYASLNAVLVSLGEVQRHDAFRAAPGELVIGNFNGIRPFNGWIDSFRIFRGTLAEADICTLFKEDLAATKEPVFAPIAALARTPITASNVRAHLPPSAIPFSTRWPRTNALAMAHDFHATHCLWVYGFDTNYMQAVHASNLHYQATLNGLQGQAHATTHRSAIDDPSGRHEDLDGNKITPPWMVTFGPRTFTGCCNSPAFRQLFFTDARRLVESGADSLHVDDWEMNASWSRNAGVCFCAACRSGFRTWLSAHCTSDELRTLGIADLQTFDYRAHLKTNGIPDAAAYKIHFRTLPLTPYFLDFQTESMRAFFRDFRHQLDTWSPKKYIPISVNGLLTPLRPEHVLPGVDVVDFLLGESSLNAEYQTAREFIFGATFAEAAQITQVVSPIPRSTARTRAAIATTYALGQPHLVPWDLYMGSDATGIQPRYFGTRAQYGDLYDFVDAHRTLLDTTAAIAEIGLLVNADLPGSYAETCLRLAARQIPFRILTGASRYARLPIRADDFHGLRLVLVLSPLDSFCAEDQATLAAARTSGHLRFAPVDKLDALMQPMALELLRLEAPAQIYAFVRADRARNMVAIHLVNWNLGGPDTERAETYQAITVTLFQPARWPHPAQAAWHLPGEPAIAITPEPHAECIRLTLPRLTTWGILTLDGATSTP
jgi:hypothetical protein